MGVKVFISSLISGYEPYRAAVAEAVETLGHQVVRAEDFPASPGTPQQAYLAAVRDSDLVVLLIGERYGLPQPSGLSATHEEYREAKERKPVLVFVESGVTREPAQQAFLDEVHAWATGHFRAAFSSSAELKSVVLHALHDHELATTAGHGRCRRSGQGTQGSYPAVPVRCRSGDGPQRGAPASLLAYLDRVRPAAAGSAS